MKRKNSFNIYKYYFTGEYKICFINNGDEDFYISQNDRIAQMVLERINRVEVVEVTELKKTVRGEGGFGSTDNKTKIDWCNFEYKEYESKLPYPPVNETEK
jgi:hypothetical protein